MKAKFVGGPYDGMEMGPDEIRAVFHDSIVKPGRAGPRQFLLMPSLADRDRILAGEIAREQPGEKLYPYEQVRHPDGRVEYHDAAVNNAFDDAMSGKPEPEPEEKLPGQHEAELAYKLDGRLNQFLNQAQREVIPPGTLGAGMGFGQTVKTSHSNDQAAGVITVTGTVTFQVFRVSEVQQQRPPEP
jgi:hypothetical protein